MIILAVLHCCRYTKYTEVGQIPFLFSLEVNGPRKTMYRIDADVSTDTHNLDLGAGPGWTFLVTSFEEGWDASSLMWER